MCAQVWTFAQACVLCMLMDMSRIRPAVNVTFDPQLLAALDEFVEKQPFKTSRAAVIEVAVREWLAAKAKERKK